MKLSKKCKITIHVLMIVQILIGIIFIIRNFNYIPEYSDTKEYIELSQTMQLDSYRPFVYPALINLSQKMANILKVNLTYVIYFIQLAISLFASVILIKTLREVFEVKINKKSIIMYSIFVFSIPFNIHFNMSILCDGIATSFTILFICYLMKFIKNEKNADAIITLILMFITANIRSEKVYFMSFMFIGILVLGLTKKYRMNMKKIITIFMIFIVGLASTKITQFVLQNKSANERSQPSISMYLYERAVGKNLAKIYEFLPDDIKKDITYEDVENSSKSANNYKIPYEKLVEKDGNAKRANTITKVAIRRNLPDIVSSTIRDFGKNIFSPYYYFMDDSSGNYEWTKTRMEGEHYLYTDTYILVFESLFIIINIYVLVFNRKNLKLLKNKELVVIWLYSFASAAFFATLTSQNFHIRYAMPVYIIEIGIVVTFINSTNNRKLKNEMINEQNERRKNGIYKNCMEK